MILHSGKRKLEHGSWFDCEQPVIGTTLKHFHIIAVLGTGGMGEVYLAQDTKLGREVAIKILPASLAADADRIARFEREARALASLTHPAIAAVHEFGQSNGTRFIVMELVPGETVAERLKRGPLPVGEAIALGIEISRALEAAHDRGIVHRDLKPQNLKLTPGGGIKVLDFGLAKILTDETGSRPAPDGSTVTHPREANLTGTGMILGTAAYMSPEQVRGEPVDPRTDIWALGCVLFEMLTGEQAFGEGTPQDCLAAILTRQPAWETLPGDLPVAAPALLRRCLRKEPAERFHHVADVRIGLEDALEDIREDARSGIAVRSGPGEDIPPGVRNHRRSRRRPLSAMTVAAAIVVVGGLGALLGIGLGGALDRSDRLTFPTVHALIPPPAGTTFQLHPVFPGPVAVSPDGTRLVFAAKAGNGPARLWIRDLDEFEPVPLAGTEYATYPFWSPDGRFVAFVADGKLKKISVAGGPAVSVTMTPIRSGGTWSADGIILATAADGAIHQIPAGGGPSKPVTEIDRQKGEERHLHPRFMPDGDHFLYMAFGRKVEARGQKPIMLASLSGDPPRELMRNVSHVECAAGHLWYVRDGVLMARPFDAGRGEVIGPPFPVAQDAINSAWAAIIGGGYFSVSPAGVIAYHTRGTATPKSQLTWYGRDGSPLGTVGEPKSQYHVSLSPEGTRAILQIETHDVLGWDLWAYDLGPGRMSRVTFRPNSALPVWSPSGERIAFDSDRSGDLEIYLKTVGRDDAEPLFTGGLADYGSGVSADSVKIRGAFPLAWSPDERYLVYCTFFEGRRADLWAVALDDRQDPIPLQQSPFTEEDAAISPDGRWLAYTSDASGRYEVYVTRFLEGGRVRQVSIAGGIRPEWNPRGGELFFLSPDYNLMAVSVAGERDHLVLGEVEPLFRIEGRYHVFAEPGVYAVGPDGERFLVNRTIESDAPAYIKVIVGWPERLVASRGQDR